MKSIKTIRIGTRESKLAVAQAQLVAEAIRKTNPDREIRLVTMKTTGDKNLEVTLDKIGGKGVFVKELDEALLRKEVDLCVHSCKDLPTEDNPALPLLAVSPREDARDVLILPKGACDIDPAKPVGCSSLRRQMQLRLLYQDQEVASVRGNVITRLDKLDRGEYSALVLAAAGIKRLGLWDRVSRAFSIEEMLPAGCQGILAIQGRAGEDHSYLHSDPDAWDAAMAERAFVRRLNCGCGAPAGVYATVNGESLCLRGMLAGTDGTLHREELTGLRVNALTLGVTLADTLLERTGELCGR